MSAKGKWPCYFFSSDTTGEKPFEEFFLANDELDLQRFETIGVITNKEAVDKQKLDKVIRDLSEASSRGFLDKSAVVDLLFKLVPEMSHEERGKYLDGRM